jgi:hypothetical protein
MDYRVKLIEILNTKVEEGLNVIETLNVADKEYGSAIMNLLNSANTARELQNQIKFDEEQANTETSVNESEEN